jgi:TonB family protein
MAAQVDTKVAPAYPPLARQARIQGMVVLKVHISKSGDVEEMQLISGHPLLAPAAIEAVKQWKYKPYLLNGEPVEVETSVTVNFTLPEKLAPGGTAGDSPSIPPGEIGSVMSDTTGDAAHQTPQRVRVSSAVQQGFLVTKVSPQYPDEAKDAHIQGVVLLKATIDKEGNVANLQIMSGHPMLAPAAIEAVKQWKYRPYLLQGNPVEVETQIQVNFTLTN